MTPEELQIAIEKASNDIHNLTLKLSRLEYEVVYKYSLKPRMNLLRDSYLTRSFIVLGHSILVNLFIVLPIYITLFLMVVFANI
ncbi:MAG: hypothetical protein HND52_07980 [Ignavibacteriae bacterium]|jgi:hypothetical protein|nr:hypothetical protein [Ignavibacteriota bacterium]NOG97886.1 hypothetical protein [Ignavibacteriota bacterium]